MATITILKTLQRLREEQEEKQRTLEEEQASKIGRQARILLLRKLPSFPWITFNPHAWEKGKIIGETERGDGTEYTVRFQNGGQPCWDYYPAYAVKILPETKK